jgi:hypothetical protein
MNLIQIQDDLKGLPTPTIMAYVNGSNPEVPPYMALSELDRRKRAEQRRAEPPTQSVKEKIESEVQQPQGIAQLTQGPQGSPPPQGPPQGQPGMPQGAPQQMASQQMPQQVPGMAAGGIARIPVRDDMFNYAPGGIVAFAGEDESLVRSNENQERGDRYPPVPTSAARMSATDPTSLQDMAPLAARQIRDQMMGKFTPPVVQSKEEIRQAMIDRATAAGDTDKVKMLSQIPGESLVPLITQLNRQNEEQRSGFKEGQSRMGLAALSNALIAAGEATRGQKGQGIGEAFGGFGKSYNAFTAEDVKRLEAQKSVERAQTIEVTTLQSKVDDLRAAYATGNVLDQQEAQKAIQEQAIKMQALKMGSAGTILTQALEQAKADTTKSHYGAMEQNAAGQLAAQIERNRAAAREAGASLQVRKDELKERMDATARAKLDDAMRGDPRITMLSKRLNDPLNPIEIGSENYDKIMDEVERIRREIMAEHPEFSIPSTRRGTPTYGKNEKGEIYVSYDGGTTREPVKRPITGGR